MLYCWKHHPLPTLMEITLGESDQILLDWLNSHFWSIWVSVKSGISCYRAKLRLRLRSWDCWRGFIIVCAGWQLPGRKSFANTLSDSWVKVSVQLGFKSTGRLPPSSALLEVVEVSRSRLAPPENSASKRIPMSDILADKNSDSSSSSSSSSTWITFREFEKDYLWKELNCLPNQLMLLQNMSWKRKVFRGCKPEPNSLVAE